MKTALVSLLWILAFSLQSPAQFKTYLPQIAVGDATGLTWRTAIVVMNTAANGTANASVIVRFTKSDGTAFDIASSFVDENRQPIGATGNTISFQISGGQTRFLILRSRTTSFPLAVGFATIESNFLVAVGATFKAVQWDCVVNGGVNGVNGCVGGADEISISEAGINMADPLQRQAIIVVHNEKNDTAVAIVNPNPTTATATFQLLATNGTFPFATVTRTLAANNHTALFISELFPNLPGSFWGTLQVTTSSQTPLAAMTLLFQTNGQFSTFPVVQMR